jgi:NTP pyrophosphatase (non-canonical NTP hydrolase)
MESLNVLVEKVKEWGRAKGISKEHPQFLKVVEELGELSKSILDDDRAAEVDAFGDVLVTLIIFADIRGVDLNVALDVAYTTISQRKGKLNELGSFIKEE